MEIRTKFDIHDVVWFIHYNEKTEKWKCFCAKITSINLNICYLDDKITIFDDYCLEIISKSKEIAYYNGFAKLRHDKGLFATKKEAQKECDKRNGNM